MSITEFLSEVAAEIGAASAGSEFKHDGRVFAVVAHSDVEFRLDPEIAEAVLRTPGTSPSSRGPDWIRLTVDADAAHDMDRAKAWFMSAFRYAERGR